MNERIGLILSLVKGPRILHVGCVGNSVQRTADEAKHCLHLHLLKTFQDCEVLGVDLDGDSVRAMREMGFDVEVCDAEDMRLGSSFDTIVAGELIEHLSNPGKFLEGCGRHLEVGGRVILSTPNPFALMYYLMYLKNFDLAFNREHAAWFCPQTLEQLAERYGLRATKTLFVDDLRPEISCSRWYVAFVFVWKLIRWVLPLRLRNTVLVVLERDPQARRLTGGFGSCLSCF